MMLTRMPRWLNTRGLVALGLSLVYMSAPLTVHAEPVALIITVGEYAHPRISPLPGTRKDSKTIQRLARDFGIDRHLILKDRQVTLRNVRQKFKELRNIAGKDDLVWVYFSGHGLQIADESGDESDRKDEVLTMYDTGAENGKIVNVLVDDEVKSLMGSLKSEHQWLIVDACHSGTISKGGLDDMLRGDMVFNAKSISVHDIVDPEHSGPISIDRGAFGTKNVQLGTKSLSSRLVSLSAAKDSEESLDSPEGGLFTNSLVSVARSLSCDQRNASNLIEGTRAKINRKLSASANKTFTPQWHTGPSGERKVLSKNCRRRQRPPSTTSTPPSTSSVDKYWSRLRTLVKKNRCRDFEVSANKSRYSIANQDEITFTVHGKRNGYLNIFAVNDRGESTVYYPNGFTDHQSNRFNLRSLRRVEIPTREMKSNSFRLVAQSPRSDDLVVAIWTKKRLNLYKSAKGDGVFKGVSGRLKELLSYLLETRSKDLAPIGVRPERRRKVRKKTICASAVEISVR